MERLSARGQAAPHLMLCHFSLSVRYVGCVKEWP